MVAVDSSGVRVEIIGDGRWCVRGCARLRALVYNWVTVKFGEEAAELEIVLENVARFTRRWPWVFGLFARVLVRGIHVCFTMGNSFKNLNRKQVLRKKKRKETGRKKKRVRGRKEDGSELSSGLSLGLLGSGNFWGNNKFLNFKLGTV